MVLERERFDSRAPCGPSFTGLAVFCYAEYWNRLPACQYVQRTVLVALTIRSSACREGLRWIYKLR